MSNDIHYPNPFDFVPFEESGPYLFTTEELEKDQQLYEGYLEVKIKAETPVHVIGRQEPAQGKIGRKIEKSFFYRYGENNQSCIPGSTIRGMLRSYIEALTNGWVSQANETYEKAYTKRHIGFDLFKVIPDKYKPSISGPRKDWKMDIATYLFGNVFEPEEKSKKEDAKAIKGRIYIEDALINTDNLSDHELPDVDATAYFGSPHPSASTWWYFTKGAPRERNAKIKDKYGNERIEVFAEFVGGKIRGRKFYFHQKPDNCIAEYEEQVRECRNNRLLRDTDFMLYKYSAESLSPGKNTETFRIHFECLPMHMILLFCDAIEPPDQIRHKIGFGKPFGLGSIETEILSVTFRKHAQGIPSQLTTKNKRDFLNEFQNPNIQEQIKKIIHPDSSEALKLILGFDATSNQVYLYPFYIKKYFRQAVLWADKKRFDEEKIKGSFEDWLYVRDVKKTVSFVVYQRRSKGYKGPQMKK